MPNDKGGTELNWHQNWKTLGLIDTSSDPSDPIFSVGHDWYFADENWVEYAGPFDTEEEARTRCAQYATTI